jgi:hypothetical protein
MANLPDGRLRQWAVPFLVGGALTLLIFSHAPVGWWPGLAIVVAGAASYLAIYLAVVAIHEGGHAAAGKLIGWNVSLAAVGPVVIRFKPFAIRIGRIPGRRNFGWVLAAPPNLGIRTRPRMTLFYVGGALANFATAGIVGAAFAALSLNEAEKGFALSVMFFSLFVGSGTLLPLYRGKVARSDGAKIIALFRAPQTVTDYDLLLTKIGLLYMSGTRPSDWDPALVARLEAGTTDDEKNASADTYLFEHYYFAGDYVRARSVLDRSLLRAEKLGVARDGLHIADAFLAAWIEHDAVRADLALARVQKPKLHQFAFARATAAICIARGDKAAALTALRTARVPRFAVNPFLRPLLLEIGNSMTTATRALPWGRTPALTPA